MKKTLIALAVAASAVVSGSAMAWENNGSGGNVELGGTLSPVAKQTPWQVQTGAAASGLDAQIQKGEKIVNITVKNTIPVLGIRTIEKTAFQGKANIAPKIDYHGAIDVSKFNSSRVPLTLNVNDSGNQKIGSLTVDMGSQAIASGKGSWTKKAIVFAGKGEGFEGAVPANTSGVLANQVIVDSLFPGAMANFDAQGITISYDPMNTNFANTAIKYSAAYGAGIEKGKIIKITLDKTASGDAPIVWKASLPVTVSYQ
ncbi:hypothetical protein LFZ28_25675 (plasmid) [Salmonella enterica subsp. enterica serovar Milwaukee str. SA19950795]|uniref:F4 family fimbrial subunit n=1 Tax=Salmonella enterica TaxID=28901 RepID=UPI00071AE8B8|nr:hypothetical protein [Salmonella enterica]AXD07386.1 hypothetical protein LFZ28_25675 [Salmonella enterica subsp. enterica serovar Milwaukee str. SA19950795]